MTGDCPCCGRSRYLTGDGLLPDHDNLALVPCAGSGSEPTGAAR